jgi:hypothetical protein
MTNNVKSHEEKYLLVGLVPDPKAEAHLPQLELALR